MAETALQLRLFVPVLVAAVVFQEAFYRERLEVARCDVYLLCAGVAWSYDGAKLVEAPVVRGKAVVVFVSRMVQLYTSVTVR